MILDNLIYDNEYKCYDILKKLYRENDIFRQVIDVGCQEGKILGFKENIWAKIREQNIRSIKNFEDMFKDGDNIGSCTTMAKQLSYSFSSCYICGGDLSFLKGTINSPDGKHTWIEIDNYIIDTTLMLIIEKNYAIKMGYIEMNRYNPNKDLVYLAAKDFALDTNLRKAKK